MLHTRCSLLTQLTSWPTPSAGSWTSPLIANPFIWMVDEPIRQACRRWTLHTRPGSMTSHFQGIGRES